MAYKRKDLKKPEKEHPLQAEYGMYGFISASNDQGWISPHLVELMNDGRFALHQFSTAIDSAKALDMSDYKPEVAKAKREELILKGKRALMGFLKKHIEKYKSECNAVSNAILRVTQPDSPSDPLRAMSQKMDFKEIRDNLRNIDPKNRRTAVAGNLSRLQAIIGNPDPSDIIIAEDTLTELRRDYAFKQDPSLIEQEKDQKEIYKVVRARAAEVSATAAKMLIYAKIDDPTPPAEFFDTFPPQTDYEAVLAAKRIESWDKKEADIARAKEFDEKKEGLNFEAGARVLRIERGIQH